MNDQVAEKEKRHLSFKINGMNCPACADRIKNILLCEEGVISATVSLQNTKALVEIKEDKIDRGSLVSAIESLGYIVVH
ncbi:MAG: cation transporter [Candidatus Thorarchaeota archaeon]|jgi:copper chaperone CopZ